MVNLEQLKKELGTRIFSATFIKKNGELRKMHCRLKVTKHLKGGEKKYDSEALNYLTVYDLKKKDYRTINLSSLIELKYNGNILKRKV